MSTLAEIQEAVTGLGEDERKALSLWLNSQTTPELSTEDEQRLLRSLDEAILAVDAGKGVSIEDVRKLVPSWVAKESLRPRPSLIWRRLFTTSPGTTPKQPVASGMH